ncbi:MAG: anthranilate synthase component I [Actinomycetota bacterium]
MSTYPSKEEFIALSKTHTLVPVCREVLGDLDTPVSAYRKLRAKNSFLLESVEHGDRWGRYSFIGVDPFLVLHSASGKVHAEGKAPSSVLEAPDPLRALDAALAAFKAANLPGLPPLHAGAVGYLGYDVVRYIERLPQTTTDDLSLDEMVMLFTGKLVVFDHLRQRMSVIVNVAIDEDPSTQYDEAIDAIKMLIETLVHTPTHSTPVSPVFDAEPEGVSSNMTPEEFHEMVHVAKEHIAAGDIFQVVLSQRFQMTSTADPFDVYRVLRLINPSPYMFFFDLPKMSIVGSSPEPLLKVVAREAISRPIAGTRWRGATEQEDRKLSEELLQDEKERAEHVMLVDLARNDLGVVCTPGTVRVAELMKVERYSHVMHIVSEVRGTLTEDRSTMDALRAAFPAGTVSGAPKIRAMQIIDSLEPTRRGPYAGCVGYIDFAGNLDACITLRTALIKDGVAYVQAGAGIVADSDPVYEETECRNKARALLTAIRAAETLTQ